MYHQIFELPQNLQSYMGLYHGLKAIICAEPNGEKIINVSPKIVEKANSEYCMDCGIFTTKQQLYKEISTLYPKFLKLNKTLLVKMSSEFVDKTDSIRRIKAYTIYRDYQRAWRYNNNSEIMYWLYGHLTDQQLVDKLTNEGCSLLYLLLERSLKYKDYITSKIKDYYEANNFCYGYVSQDLWTDKQLKKYKETKRCSLGVKPYQSTIKINHPDLLWVFDVDCCAHYVVESGAYGYCTFHFPNVHPNGEICFGYVEKPSSPKELINNFWGSHFNMDLTIKSQYIAEYVIEFDLDRNYYEPDDYDSHYDEGYEGELRAQDWYAIMPDIAYYSSRESWSVDAEYTEADFEDYVEVPTNTHSILVIDDAPEPLCNYYDKGILFVREITKDDYICDFYSDITDIDKLTAQTVKINKEKLANG